jgi:MFS family permease
VDVEKDRRHRDTAEARMTTRRFTMLLAALVVFTAARVMTTHRVFSQTSDEPYHLAAGYDFLTKGTYSLEPEHPPLARVIHALPFVDAPEPTAAEPAPRGNQLLLSNDRYTQNLGRARLGNLLFLSLAIIGVALWGRHLFSPDVGLLAALLYASLPPVLAHGGVATTDMAGAATFTLALFAVTRFLERPSWKQTLLLGLAIAAGVLSKYSFIVYFPPAVLILLIVRRRLPLARMLAAIALAFAIVWATFGFSVGTLVSVDPLSIDRANNVFGSTWIVTAVPFPAPRLVNGILIVKNHDVGGHPAFLFGEKRWEGWWYYFPIALFFKTPIPFLLLALTGCALVARRRAEVALIAVAVLGVAMTSHLNIGVRHVLPIYAPLAIAAAFAVLSLPRLRIASAVLVAWLLVGIAAAHPDYLPWFNFAAGRHPERILNDSNLDWGQDVLRLVRTARAKQIEEMTVSLFTTADLDRIGLPRHTILQAMSEVDGWLAISEMNVAQGRAYSPEVRKWLDELLDGKPYVRIGKSIRLYDFRGAR